MHPVPLEASFLKQPDVVGGIIAGIQAEQERPVCDLQTEGASYAPFLTGAFSNYVSIIIYDFCSKFYFHPRHSSVPAVSKATESL